MIVGTGCTIGLGYWTAIIQHAHKSMFRVTRGGRGRRVLQIFQNIFRSPGDHRPKYFMAQ